MPLPQEPANWGIIEACEHRYCTRVTGQELRLLQSGKIASIVSRAAEKKHVC